MLSSAREEHWPLRGRRRHISLPLLCEGKFQRVEDMRSKVSSTRHKSNDTLLDQPLIVKSSTTPHLLFLVKATNLAEKHPRSKLQAIGITFLWASSPSTGCFKQILFCSLETTCSCFHSMCHQLFLATLKKKKK